MKPVNFFYACPPFNFRDRTRLKAFLLSIFKKEQRSFESLNYIFCTDDYLLTINQDYLQHDYYTDIITFDLASAKEPAIGEIYISIDRVRENANLHRTTFSKELHRVIFHGILHLCGYKDKTAKDSQLMRAKEEEYLNLYFSFQ